MYLILILLIITVAYLYLIAPSRNHPDSQKQFNKLFIAHRGLYSKDQSVPENSITAFDKAVQAGYGIELDVRLSKDGQVVVIHDNNLRRLCNKDDFTENYTYKELHMLSLKGTSERIPLLTDVLDFVKSRVPIIIELKSGKQNHQLCIESHKILAKYPGTYCIESFNPFIVRWFKKHAPNIYRGQLTASYKKLRYDNNTVTAFLVTNLLLNCLSRPHFVSRDINIKDSIPVNLCHLMGAKLVGWTQKDANISKTVQQNTETIIFEHFLPNSKF